MGFLGGRFLMPLRSAGEGFARKQLDGGTVGRRHCGRRNMLLGRVAVLVILEVFENVADVEESVAIQADVHESRLHAREDASNFSFVDAADESEFLFPLDVNFD